MYLTHAILHKTAEDPKPNKLDPRVKSWLEAKKKAGEKQYMGADSIIGMIQADKAMKGMQNKIQNYLKVKQRTGTTSPEWEKKLAEYNKHKATVDTFNKRRGLRKEHGVTHDFYNRERDHEKRAIKASSDAFRKTLMDAGFKGEGFENIPPEVRAKAEEAAKAAGEKYVKGRLGFLSDKEASDIQRYSQFQQARRQQGITPQAFQYDDPNFRNQMGQFAMSYGASQQMQDAADKFGQDPMGALKQGAQGLKDFATGKTSMPTPDTAYNQYMDKMRSTYMDATKNMQQRYSDERTAKIKKWAPWVIGGGALATGLLSAFSGSDKADQVEPLGAWEDAAQNPDRMAWTKSSYRDAARNPHTPAPTGKAPKSPFGGAFRNFMSQNPFQRA